MTPDQLKYSSEHEWVFVDENGVGLVGISQHAADSLGDVVFVDLPVVGDSVDQFGKMGEIESVKAFSELFSPVGGEVLEVNSILADAPDLVNESPYEKGWMIKVKLKDATEIENLMTLAEYEDFILKSESN
ncbi:MAG: glycine cleavage system protein GcvH [Chloroflexota bacterium]|nr:glycine cleavage system protein GcvH [Chloroflexota bacterium]